jgi:hypothetical protein
VGYNATVASSTFKIPRSTKSSKNSKTSDVLDISARYFAYKLYDASRGGGEPWHSVRAIGEVAATVSRAVERGWVIVRDEGKGKAAELCAALTGEGRAMARKGLR